MQDRSIPLAVLLNEAFRLLPQFLALVAITALACGALYLGLHSFNLLWVPVAIFYALVFFCAPLASSAVRARRRVHVMSRPGIKTLIFSFVWGGLVAALFIATLHIGQGMETTTPDYLATISVGGFVCAALACIPGTR